MYVTDSLFFLQHLISGNENDENRQMFGVKFREIIDSNGNQEREESAEDIRNRIIEKSKKLSGEKV